MARDSASEAIARANQELAQRCEGALELPIAVLVEQRDRLAREQQSLREAAAAERQALVDDQDAFIADIMAEHERGIAALEHELSAAREQTERQTSLMTGRTGDTSPGMPAVRPGVMVIDDLEAQVRNLQSQLESAYRDVDEARADTARLQDQLEQAKSDASEARFEMSEQVQAARDEAFALQQQVEEANRRVEDVREQARDEAFRLNEQIADVTRDLDERRHEVRRLRARLSELDREGALQSIPPPGSDSARELDAALAEARQLRKQLIEVKRESSRKSRELEEARAAARRSSARKGAEGTPSTPPRPPSETPPEGVAS